MKIVLPYPVSANLPGLRYEEADIALEWALLMS